MGRLSTVDRIKIVDRVLHGKETMRAVAGQFNVSPMAVSKLIKKYRSTGSTADIRRQQRPKKLMANDLKRIKRAVERKPKRSLKKTEKALKLKVCPETLRKALHDMDFESCRSRRVPKISDKNVKARVSWASEHLLRPHSYWQRLCVTDESRFTCVGNDAPARVWRKKGQALKPSCTTGRIQGGGGNVLVWGGLSFEGPGPLVWLTGTVDSTRYCALLRDTIDPWLKSLPFHPIMVQDGAPCHTSTATRKTLTELNIDLMDWCAQSPDANCIENVWSVIKRRLSDKKTRTPKELWLQIQKQWRALTSEECKRLILSTPRRMQAIVSAKGHPTPY